jgi:pyruvate,orthophosphate dikinase
VVARQLGKVCLVGCDTLEIDLPRRRIRIGAQEFGEFDLLSLDGNTGAVFAGAVRTVRREPVELLRRLEALRAHHDAK